MPFSKNNTFIKLQYTQTLWLQQIQYTIKNISYETRMYDI